MITEGTETHLYLDGQLAGKVLTRHGNHAWGFGDFLPTPQFSAFANLFGRWSLLMHADGEKEPLSPAASEELRETEIAIDALKARLFVPERGEWHLLSQLNIDGPLIEWQEA